MSWVAIRDGILSGIADAIREKTGKTSTILPGEMAAEIESIETGGGGGNNNLLLTLLYGKNLYNYYPDIHEIDFGDCTIIRDSLLDSAMCESGIKKITGNYVEEIGAKALNNGTSGTISYIASRSLLEIDFPVCKTIGENAFRNDVLLETVNLPSVETIKSYAFCNCKALTEFVLPSSLLSLEYNAFQNCVNMGSVKFMGTPTTINSTTFSKCTSLTDIYVPWAENTIANAPWGATNATIHYNTTFDDAGNIVT